MMSIKRIKSQHSKHSSRHSYNPVVRRSSARSVTIDEKKRFGGKQSTEGVTSREELAFAVALLNEHSREYQGRNPWDVMRQAGIEEERISEGLSRLIAQIITNVYLLVLFLAPHAAGAANSSVERLLSRIRSGIAGTTAGVLDQLRLLVANLDQLHSCAVCGTFFVPKRRDQRCCTRACAGTLRVRRHRAKQGQYEQNRKDKLAGVGPEGE
jgi:hypothetical protein